MHFSCHTKLSDFSPLKNVFYSFRAKTDKRHPIDPESYTAVVARGVADLHRHTPEYARSEYHRQLAKMFFFVFFLDPPGDPGEKSLSPIHFRLCTSFRPTAERRLCVNLAPPV